MALESVGKIKELDEYMDILKQDLLFLMAERKLKPENTNNHKIITIKRELDKAVQEKMRLNQIHYSNTNNRIALTSAASV